jgi:hypothetical protein
LLYSSGAARRNLLTLGKRADSAPGMLMPHAVAATLEKWQ